MMKQVIKLGDGHDICEECWKREFEAETPETGWFAGECDFCKTRARGKTCRW